MDYKLEKKLFCILFSIFLISCSASTLQGTYKFRKSNTLKFEGDRYTFYSNEYFKSRYSRGKYLIRKNKVEFIADSALYPCLKVLNVNHILGKGKKTKEVTVVLFGFKDEKEEFRLFHIVEPFLDKGIYKRDTIDFIQLSNGSYTTDVNYNAWFNFKVYIEFKKDKYLKYIPVHNKQIISTNSIDIEMLQRDISKFDTINLSIDFNRGMFETYELPTFILKKGRLIQEDWPIYEKSKK